MRKILFGILALLMTALAIVLVINGLHLGFININGTSEIQALSDGLTNKIEEARELTSISYNKANQDLTSALTELKKQKQEYQKKYEEIGAERLAQALTEDRHEVEYLWTKIGNYAKNNNVKITLDLKSNVIDGLKDIDFTVVGSYKNIINFLYDLENDEILLFRIEDFKLLPVTVKSGSASSTLQATFTVHEVYVIFG